MRYLQACTIIVLIWLPLVSAAADNAELESIRQQIEMLRSEYESRIQELERRLEQAESQARKAGAEAERARQQAEAISINHVLDTNVGVGSSCIYTPFSTYQA